MAEEATDAEWSIAMKTSRRRGFVSALALMCLLPASTTAGSNDLRLRFNVLAGASHSGFAHASQAHHTYRKTTNPAAGLLLAWPRTRGSALETGAIFEWRGGYWFSGFAPDGTYLEGAGFKRQLDLAYILVPIRVRAGLPSLAVSPSLHAGVEVARRVWSRQTTDYRATGAQYSRTPALVSDWDVALAAGGRLSVPRACHSPFLEMTYSSGLNRVDGSQFKIEGSIPAITSRAYRVLLGLEL